MTKQEFDCKIAAIFQSYSSNKSCVVHSNGAYFPIYWFGDLLGYLNSSCKVVTVGLNPSEEEYVLDSNEKYIHFANDPGALLASGNYIGYAHEMNEYFRYNPYWWFNNYEFFINQIGASYYDYPGNPNYNCTFDTPNRAIHIDMMAPVPGKLPWSRMESKDRNALIKQYSNCFNILLKLLAPDIIVVSTGKDWVNKKFSIKNRIPTYNLTSDKGYIKGYLFDNEYSVSAVGTKKLIMVSPSRMPIQGISKKVIMDFLKIF